MASLKERGNALAEALHALTSLRALLLSGLAGGKNLVL